MASQQIFPNINVDASGNIKSLPDRDTILSSGFDWICAILEVVAARLHHQVGGTTTSTTTVGLVSEIGCLCLTSQSNGKFPGITPELVCGWIDELSHVNYEGFLKTLGVANVYSMDASTVQSLQSNKAKEAKAMVQTINFVYYNLYPSFVRLAEMKRVHPEVFPYIKSLIKSVLVITNDQLLPKSTTTTGLHGEGRFVRFCYIRYVTDLTLLDLTVVQRPAKVRIPGPRKLFTPGGVMQPQIFEGDDESESHSDEEGMDVDVPPDTEALAMAERYRACMAKLKQDGHVNVMKIYVASSQGTCVDCQNMLAELGITHNTHRYSKESPSANWVDPFTWKDIKSGSAPVERLSARNMGQQFGANQFEALKKKSATS